MSSIHFQILNSNIITSEQLKKKQRLIYGDFHTIIKNVVNDIPDWKYINGDHALITSINENKKLKLDVNQIYYSIGQQNFFKPEYEHSIIYDEHSNNDSLLTINELCLIANKIQNKLNEYLGYNTTYILRYRQILK